MAVILGAVPVLRKRAQAVTLARETTPDATIAREPPFFRAVPRLVAFEDYHDEALLCAWCVQPCGSYRTQ
jgi:hypothetical protein